uniref:Uncharacterized protein n=1 Tax=Panagrolaimus sp. JU765 TaxID=591449 RepID=A0AC34QWZ8_9BILA
MDGETFRAFTSYLESVSGPSLSNGNLPMQQFLPNPYAPNMNPNLNNQQLLCLLLQANQANLPQMNPIYQQLMNQSGSTTITHRVNPAYSYPMTTQTPQLSSSLPTHPGIIHNTQISQNRNSISPQSDDGMNRKRRHDKAPPTHSPSKSPSLPVKENSQPRVESLKQQSEIMAAADSPLRHHPAFTPQLSSSLPTHPGIIHNTQISQNRNSISPQSDDGMNRKRRHDKAPPTHSPSKSPSLPGIKQRERSLTCPDISKLVNEPSPVKENSQPRVESLKQQSEIMAAADSPLRHHPAFLPKPDRDVFKVEFLTLFYLSGLQGFAAAAAASEESNGTTDSVPNVTMSDVHHLIEEVVRSDA